MGQFAYTARDARGARVTGTLAGASEQVVLAELATRELAPVSVSEIREQAISQVPFLRPRRISSRRLARMYRQLSDLLRAGVPLLRALRLLGRGQSDQRMSKVMSQIAEAVADGQRLADAMEAQRDVFPPIQIAMVRAGEAGGFLEQVLSRLGDFLEHQADLRSKVIGNLIYPAILLTLALFVVIGALVFFVPKFETMFSRIELPLPTILLLGVSNALTEHWIWIVLGLSGVGVLIAWLRAQESVRRKVAVAQLHSPWVGPFVSGLAVARFTRILGTMLGNGIPLLQAMKISRDAAGHVVLAESIDNAAESVRAGESLAAPLGQSGFFGEDVVEMISVGEQANNLPEVLITIADTIERRIDRMLSLLLRLMEPALLIVLAGVVVFIFVALFLPMLRMSTALGGS
jgi:general secretion pathway protein F/type IV pilus assembly protein PilC